MQRRASPAEKLGVIDGGRSEPAVPPFAVVPAAQRLKLEWFEDVRPSLNARWLVKGLIGASTLALVYGEPGCGKSFLTVDLALHLALNREWFGRKVVGGTVLYVAAEGAPGLRLRVEAFRREHAVTGSVPFALVPAQVDLLDPDADVAKLADAMATAAARHGQGLVLVVIDTLSRTFGGGDESGSDMTAYLANIGRLQAFFDCTFILVHHRPKDHTNRTPRGHGSLQGAADTILLVEAGETKRVIATKQKDAELGADLCFSLTQVELGHDDDGDVVTSCVVAQQDAPAAKRDRVKLSDPQAVALRALRDRIAPPGSTGDRAMYGRAVSFADFKDMLFDLGLMYVETRRNLPHELRTALLKKRLIHVADKQISVTDAGWAVPL